MHPPAFTNGSGLHARKQSPFGGGLCVSALEVRRVQTPPSAAQLLAGRRGGRRCRGPCDPAGWPRGGAAPTPPRAQSRGGNTRRDAGQPTQGSLRTWKKEQVRSRPSPSVAITEAFRRAEQTWRPAKPPLRAGRPLGTPPTGSPLGRAGEVRGSRGLRKAAAPPVVRLPVGLGSLLRGCPEAWERRLSRSLSARGLRTGKPEAEPAADGGSLQPGLLPCGPGEEKPSSCEEEGPGGSAHGHGKKKGYFGSCPLPRAWASAKPGAGCSRSPARFVAGGRTGGSPPQSSTPPLLPFPGFGTVALARVAQSLSPALVRAAPVPDQAVHWLLFILLFFPPPFSKRSCLCSPEKSAGGGELPVPLPHGSSWLRRCAPPRRGTEQLTSARKVCVRGFGCAWSRGEDAHGSPRYQRWQWALGPAELTLRAAAFWEAHRCGVPAARPGRGASPVGRGPPGTTGAALPTGAAATAREPAGAPRPAPLGSAARRYCPTRGP